MAIFQVATNTPPKSEIIAGWLASQTWGPAKAGALEVVGSYHLEDPEGQVGMQGHLLDVGGIIFHVPLTYRSEPVPDMEGAFMSTMEHSVLGTRYVYDGMGDERFISVLAGVTASGYGQSLGFAMTDGRWQAWPETAKLIGHGSVAGRIVVDRLERESGETNTIVLRNEDIELTVHRRPLQQEIPGIALTATWPGQAKPVVLSSIVAS